MKTIPSSSRNLDGGLFETEVISKPLGFHHRCTCRLYSVGLIFFVDGFRLCALLYDRFLRFTSMCVYACVFVRFSFLSIGNVIPDHAQASQS